MSSHYPINTTTNNIPVSKYGSKSLILSKVVKPIADAIDKLDDATLKNLQSLIISSNRENAMFQTYGIFDLMTNLQTQEMKENIKEQNKPFQESPVLKLGGLIKREIKLITELEEAKARNPGKTEAVIEELSKSEGYKPEISFIIKSLYEAMVIVSDEKIREL